MHWLQLLAGISDPILANTSIPLPHLQYDLFICLRNFLHSINASIIIPGINDNIPQPLQQHDKNIMNTIVCHHRPREITDFNTVRIWMGVTFLSEICTTNRTAIATDAWTGTRKRFTNHLWLYQPQPNKKCFITWRRLLASAFLHNKHRVSKKTINLLLTTPLSNWLDGSQWFQRKWQNYYNSLNKELYIFNNDTHNYDIHKKWRHSRQRLRGRTRGTLFYTMPHKHSQQLPPNLLPTDVTSSNTFYQNGLVFPTNLTVWYFPKILFFSLK